MPMKKLVVKMSTPVVISMIIQALYNMVDSLFVAQLGLKELTALGLASPIQMVIIAISNGIGSGMNSAVSRKSGAGKHDEMGRAVGNAITLILFAAALLALFGLFGTRSYFQLCSYDADVIELGTEYLSICCIFYLGEFVSIIGQRILQVTGQPNWGLFAFVLGAVFNIIFDPILIFGLCGFPALGIRGAAIATVCGQALGGLVAILICTIWKKGIALKARDFVPSKDILEICKTGAPAAVALAVSAVMSFGMNQILKADAIAVAVFTAYYKLWSFSVMPVNGVAQSMIPVIGYNYGARDKKRLDFCISIVLKFSVIVSVLFAVVFWVFAPQLISLFDNGMNGDIFLDTGTRALHIIAVSVLIAGVSRMTSNLFQGVGNGVPSLVYAALSQCVVLLPVAAILVKVLGTDWVWPAFIIAEVVSGIVVIFLYRKNYKKYIQNL